MHLLAEETIMAEVREYKSKRNFKYRTIRILFLLLIIFTIKSCKPAVKDPTDREMINHFNKYRTDFEMIRQIIAEDTISAFDYPPILCEGKYRNVNDSVYFSQLNIDKKENWIPCCKMYNVVEYLYFPKMKLVLIIIPTGE